MNTRISQLKKWTLLAGLFAVVTAAPAVVSAQDAGFYAGGAVGKSELKDACVDTAPLSCKDNDTAYKIFGGYQFNKNFGAELGYVNLGKATASGTILGVPVSADIKAKGFELLGVGTLPLADKFSAYGKLGFFRWDVDASARVGAVTIDSASENGTDLTYGIGVKYDFAKNMGVRLEWQRYKDLGNEATTGKSDVDLLSIGIVFKF